jgi:hypothetical protein
MMGVKVRIAPLTVAEIERSQIHGRIGRRTNFAKLAGRYRTLRSPQSELPEHTRDTLDVAAISEYPSEQNAATFH